MNSSGATDGMRTTGSLMSSIPDGSFANTVVFAMGAAFLVASLGAFFADTSNVVSVAMRLMFYVSPVFYFVRDRGGHTGQIHNETIRFWYLLNPLACFMECYRDSFLWGLMPQFSLLLYVTIFSILFWLVGFIIFTLGEGRFA